MDLNNDGIRDVIHGSGGGPCQLYYGNSDGTFKDMGPIQVNGDKLHLYYYSFYEVTDWNEDGLWDLIGFGAKEDTYTLYINEGTKEQYLFNKELKTKEEGGIGFPDLPSTRNCPSIVDFDYDGKKDLLNGISSGGYVEFYKNQGTNSSPSFNYDDKVIVTNDGGNTWTEKGLEAKIDVVDLNGDGRWDIIAGGCGGGKPATEQFLYISYGYGDGQVSNQNIKTATLNHNIAKQVIVTRIKGEYKISNTNEKSVNISLFNMRGISVISNLSLRAKESITISDLGGQSFYVLNISSSNGETFSKKIITFD